MSDNRQDNLREAALAYHEFPRPGKLEVRATKPLANGRDLARAYSPGVAEACLESKDDPIAARRPTIAIGFLYKSCVFECKTLNKLSREFVIFQWEVIGP